MKSFRQDWIPFNWESDSFAGRYLEKVAITIPVSIDTFLYKFNMQFDLGANTTMFYENSIAAFPDLHNKLQNAVSRKDEFSIFKNVDLKLGNVSFEKRDIVNYKNYGDTIPKDSIYTQTEKHIGTIGVDFFQGKILIIDYPNQRICVTTELPKQFADAVFQPCKTENGRVKIPFLINNKLEDLLFDTGSSLFALMTTEEKAKQISANEISDSLEIPAWGNHYTEYGQKISVPIYFGQKQLEATNVYYDRVNRLNEFFNQEKIWGITGNAYFLNNVVIIDFKNSQFGVK